MEEVIIEDQVHAEKNSLSTPNRAKEKAMWLDVNNCPQTFHELKKVDGKWVCLHGDDSECEEVEFGGEMEE